MFIGYGKRFQRYRHMQHHKKVCLRRCTLFFGSDPLPPGIYKQVTTDDDPFVKITNDAGHAVANSVVLQGAPRGLFPIP